jgi:toxin YhaV
MGMAYRHWRRAKIGRRFRLFFRYDSKAKVIVFAWVNDAHTLRSAGSSSDPYAVFQKMLDRGNPPDDWAALLAASSADLGVPGRVDQS